MERILQRKEDKRLKHRIRTMPAAIDNYHHHYD
jgi:hypothetical protein